MLLPYRTRMIRIRRIDSDDIYVQMLHQRVSACYDLILKLSLELLNLTGFSSAVSYRLLSRQRRVAMTLKPYHLQILSSSNQHIFELIHFQINRPCGAVCCGWKWKARRGEAHRARGSGAEGTKTPLPRCPVWLSPEDL